jgi:hypothetical protein
MKKFIDLCKVYSAWLVKSTLEIKSRGKKGTVVFAIWSIIIFALMTGIMVMSLPILTPSLVVSKIMFGLYLVLSLSSVIAPVILAIYAKFIKKENLIEEK